MRPLAPLLVALVLACAPPAPTAPPPTATPAPIPTKPAPSPTAGADYVALRTALLTPLGGLIVATRDNSPTRPQQRAAFDAAAQTVEATISGDTSVNANRLHSAIANARDAAARGDLAALERVRADLLMVR